MLTSVAAVMAPFYQYFLEIPCLLDKSSHAKPGPMKTLIVLLIICFISACRDDRNRRALNTFADDGADTVSYPLFIDGGRKVVYQFGHLTADRGLKLYFDTIPYPAEGFKVDESVRKKLSVE